MKQYSILKECTRISWEEASRDPFISKLSEITGVIHEDYFTNSDWEKIVKSLKTEALMDATVDTASSELQLEVIFKCYWSGIPRLVSLAKDFGEFLIKEHEDKDHYKHNADYYETIRIGYMSKLANAIELYCLKKQPFHDIDTIYNKDSDLKPGGCFYRYKIGQIVQLTWRALENADPSNKYTELKDRYAIIVNKFSKPGKFDPRHHAVYTVKLAKNGKLINVNDEEIEDDEK